MFASTMEKCIASMRERLIPPREVLLLLLLLLSFCRKTIMFIFWALEQKNRRSSCKN